MIVILWDSLRIDCTEPLHGIFDKETWGSFRTIAGFTAPVIASTITGVPPDKLGLHNDTRDFYTPLDPTYIKDTLFDHFDSYISFGRLIGPETQCCPLPPSRRDNKYVFMPPIKWNAVSNWDIDAWRYVGIKWSMSNPQWWDLLYWHSFVTHGNFSIYDSMGAVESPEIKDGSRVMRNLAFNNPEGLRDLYMKGVYYAAETLRGFKEMCGDKETIICFADHGESFGPVDGMPDIGHFAGLEQHPVLGTVPLWINRDEEIPKDINNLNLKDWIVKMYEKYEKNNPSYQQWKEKKMKLCQ